MSDDATLYQDGDGIQRARELSRQRRQPPTQVPGYELTQFLGAGAYGEVWVAVDENTGRRVAIKFYAHRGGLDWSLLSREVEKLSFLFADRHVVQLLDVGWESNPPFYVMEHLEEGSLDDYLAAGPMPVDDAVRMFREIAIGLMHAHGKGVLHCDLKPANILLDQDHKPRLADFGQSRLSNEQTPALGTLYYMAPEQADLDAAPDARWDVYALGAVLYRMLTGIAPHRGDLEAEEIESATDLDERLKRYRQAIRNAPPLTKHRKIPGVDKPLAEIIDNCLAPDPKRRYRNVQAVLDALKKRESSRARRPLLILGAVGPAVLLVVMTLFAWRGFEAAVSRSTDALTKRALESNGFAAQFVSETVARRIERRWEILSKAAEDPEIQRWVKECNAQGLTTEQFQRVYDILHTDQDADLDPDDPIAKYLDAMRQLRATMERLRNSNMRPSSTSWFVQDRHGISLARHPHSTVTFGGNFSGRDYFHGRGRDLDLSEVDAESPEIIDAKHRSIVFTSKSTKRRMVAFSVPVFDLELPEDQRQPIGVVAMTVHLGSFAELRPEDAEAQHQLAVLIDTRPDETGRRGAVLEHPGLAASSTNGKDATGPRAADTEPEAYYVDEGEIARLELVLEKRHEIDALAKPDGEDAEPRSPANPTQRSEQMSRLGKEIQALAWQQHYVDPVTSAAEGEWLAAIEPVVVAGTPDTHWFVVIQEKSEAAVAPISALGSSLMREGLLALGVFAGVITALWGFVVRIVQGPSRNSIIASIRRRAGIAGDTVTPTGSVRSTRSS